MILPPYLCLSTSHCYEEKSYIKWPAGRHEFSELFKRPIYHFEFFSYVAKEGRGKNRGNYNSGHRLHAKDFFGNNFAISQGDFKEGEFSWNFPPRGQQRSRTVVVNPAWWNIFYFSSERLEEKIAVYLLRCCLEIDLCLHFRHSVHFQQSVKLTVAAHLLYCYFSTYVWKAKEPICSKNQCSYNSPFNFTLQGHQPQTRQK